MTRIVPVLYCEDDENDVFLMERAFQKLEVTQLLQVAGDGKVAVAYLSGEPPFENREQPCLILLDLSMPGKHGLEVLKWIKSQPTLLNVPVVVFTSSNQASDVTRCYELGVDGYIIKPGDPAELIKIVRCLKDYWLGATRPAGTFLDFAVAAHIPLPKLKGNVTSGPSLV